MSDKTTLAKKGRPAHTDDPPRMVGTTVPESVIGLLNQLTIRLERPKSEILSDAIRAYARRYPAKKHMKK
jgi:hypothetical protein